MNNIFKVIWNHATQTWTAVGELASAKGKSKSVKLAAISTALLAVADGTYAAGQVEFGATDNNGMTIAPNAVTDQFFGKSEYTKITGESKNKQGATVKAYDGIAIGSGSLSGSTTGTGGNGHVAIGLMAQATGNRANGENTGGADGDNAAVALGAYSLAAGQGSTALGAHSLATEIDSTAVGKIAHARGQSSTAIGQQAEAIQRATATGAETKALGTYSTAMGQKATANSWDSIAVGSASTVSGKNSINVGSNSVLSGENIATVGAYSKISSNNVSTLGSNITVAEGRDGAVVLGYGSDAGKETTKVMAVNSAVAEGSPLVYSGFSGKLGGTDTNGTNKEATGKQGNVVSVGSEGNERQIKHVAAGQITAESTDAINGSQLYQVAKTLGTAANQTANALGVTLNPNGTLSGFSQPLTIAEGSDYNKYENGQKKPDITAPNVTTALTNLNNYVNAGWNVTASGNGYKNNVSIGHTVNFVGLGNVDVDGVDEENGVRTINISTDSPIDYASTTFDGKPVTKASDGKWYQVDENGDIKGDPIDASKIDKKGAKLTDSDTENNPYEKGNSYTYDDKGNITETGYDKTKPESKDKITAGEHGVQLSNVGWATQPDQAVNKDQLDQTVNKSGFYVQQNGKSTLDGKTGSDKVSDTEKVTPNDVVNFADGDGTIVKVKTVRDDKGVDTTTVSVDVDAAKVIEKTKGSIKEADVSNPDAKDAGKVAVNGTPAPKADGKNETQEEANAREGNKLATVGNVVDAINSAKWFAKVENTDKAMTDRAQNDTTDKKAAAIGAGETLTLKADKNLAVKRDGANVTYGLASEIEVDKITVKSKTPGEATTTFENGKVTNLKDHLTPPKEVAADKAAVPNAEEVKTPTELTADKKKEAATVNDVLNAGWNLKANGKQVAAVTNGKGVDFESDGSITITPTVENGIAKMKFAVNTDASIDKNKGSIKEADVSNPGAKDAGKVAVNGTPAQKADGSMETQDEANAREGNKVATVQNVVNAINSAATFVKVADSQEVITASTANDKGVAVKSGDTVTHTAGKNLKVKRDGQSVTYALAQDIDVDSVKAKNGVTIGSGDNATTITSDDKGLNLAGKNGVATNINNVKDADLNSTSKQAVNGSQLHATNEKVASLGTTVNNLDRKVNKHSKQARAGIAGANAAAALPQAYTQGKAMVAAAAGTFKGQNALAVGYSRISDNGKVILKLQGNANTSGDVGAGVGVGYQW
ncbi:MAG: YadA-like family protein [Haemophilus parainfluenzae]|uniref:YadA-like family protein n=1 Tax=uncultured Haemophilus sp. TaxID=237779 RepID=UPI002805C1DB|nr:YadA-like family protein [uncultured Haemophilus sp.]MDU4565752.1 YadA-like family protein [Haemophilus parainfluenzae]MDU4637410.1 YadA-like family protein [Haemophilus parainfluenzae]MDU5990063.1 YadA-like family protein [Haemophilus parainfluenzae]